MQASEENYKAIGNEAYKAIKIITINIIVVKTQQSEKFGSNTAP